MDELERIGAENFAAMRETLRSRGIDAAWEEPGVIEVATRPHEVPGLSEAAEAERAHGAGRSGATSCPSTATCWSPSRASCGAATRRSTTSPRSQGACRCGEELEGWRAVSSRESASRIAGPGDRHLQPLLRDLRRALGGRVAYAVGYTRLEMVRARPIPFPPEPFRYGAIQLTRRALARADERGGRRGIWLRALDRIGAGFDS
jgi:hypothetical protein